MSWQTCTAENMQQFKSVYNAAADYFSRGIKIDLQIREHQSKRKDAQNALQFHWFLEMEMQGDKSSKEYRAYCKLHHGVPIAREDEKFRLIYDKVIRPASYENKLLMMVEPIDLPVTSNFGVKQMTRYLEAIQADFSNQNIKLTSNDDLYWEAMGVKR